MAHVQKRCTRRACRRIVSEGHRACEACGNRAFAYVARYVDPDGRERSESFARRSAADQRLAEIETAKARRTYVDPAAGRETFEAFFTRWQARASLSPSTVHKYDRVWRLHVAPQLARRQIAQITREDVRSMIQGVERPHQQAEALKLTRMLLNRAMDADIIGRNVAARIAPPETTRGKVRVLSPSELSAVVEELPERWRAFVLLGAYASLRWSELAAVRRDDLDLEARTVRVDEKVVEVRGAFEWGPPKTPESNRVVDLPELLVRPLAEHLLRFPPLLGSADPHLDGLVFYGERKGPVRRRAFRLTWQDACRAAGVEPIRLEWIRHTGASIAYAATRDMKAVAARLGHTSTRMMDTLYVQVYPESSRQVADAIDALVVTASAPLTGPIRDAGGTQRGEDSVTGL